MSLEPEVWMTGSSGCDCDRWQDQGQENGVCIECRDTR